MFLLRAMVYGRHSQTSFLPLPAYECAMENRSTRRSIAFILFAGLFVLSAAFAGGCKSGDAQKDEQQSAEAQAAEESQEQGSAARDKARKKDQKKAQKKAQEGERLPADREPVMPEGLEEGQAVATFAGGCFWCMEPPFDDIEGVQATIVGYTGGAEQNPTYKQVSYGKTGHTEAIQVRYDPEQVTYERLLAVFWRNIDPTAVDRQFVDVGAQYRTGIFYHDAEQKKLAEQSKKAVAASGRFDEKIVTPVVPAARFWRAEEYHQNYYKKSPTNYKRYRRGSGRDPFIKKYWGDRPDSIQQLEKGGE